MSKKYGKLVTDCCADSAGDGKRMFIGLKNNDGWQDLRIEVDTDDVDSGFARKAARELIRRWNSFEK